MYVIFPAEEVVYFTYGYRRILSAPNQVPNQVPSTTSPNTTTTPPSNLPVNINNKNNNNNNDNLILNNYNNNNNNNNNINNNNNNKNLTEQQPTSSTSALRQKKISNASNIIINANTSESCSSNSGKLQDDSKNGSTPKRPSRKKQKVALSVTSGSGTVTPTKSKSKEHTPDIEDFFERAKNRPRVNTFDNLKVPDQQYYTSSLPLNIKKFQAKSAPSTPIAARKSPLYRSFETERQHISTITLNLDRSTSDTSNKSKRKKEQVAKETPSTSRGRTPDFDFLFLDPEEQRIRRSPSTNRFDQSTPEKSPTKKKTFFLSLPTRTKHNKSGNLQQDITTDNFLIGGGYNMAATQHGVLNNESCLRELTHSSFNEPLKAQNAVTFKLVKTVSDFTQHLSQIYEQNAEQLQLLVENFRKRNGELRKERPACPSSLFHTWETLLQEVEIDSQNHSDIASILSRQVSRPLLERSFHRKIQSRKVFTHRESFETIISKTEEKLSKCRLEYKTAYLSYLSEPSQKSLSGYFNTHNAYVQQLHATNGMLDEYSKTTLPNLLQELEEIYTDLCSSVAESILQGAEVISQRATDQTRRYDSLSSQCRGVSGPTDLIQFARALPTPAHNKPILRRLFNPPQPPHNDNSTPGDGANTATSGTSDGAGQFDHFNEINIPPPLKNELVIDRLASVQIKPSLDALRKEQQDLETQIKQIQDSLDALIRVKQRSLESQLFNKVNELEEDISAKRFDLHVAQIHLRAIQFQKELFTSKADAGDSSRERKMSSTSQGSMKSKWLKAFKSLKTPPSSANTSPRESEKEKRNGGGMRNMGESEAHTFQEYTYKKITPCDVCSQVLRGHTRQGLKCRVCKMNVHVDCQEKATRCQSKSRLLRRQKSTSEIDTRFNEAAVEEETSEFDGEDNYFTYPKVNRQLSFKDTHSRVTYIPTELDTKPISGSTSTSDGSMRRRLFAGMKSLTGFGSRSRHGSPNSRSISLPEKRGSTSGQGNRPFGQPLCLMVPEDTNGKTNFNDAHSKSPSPLNHKSNTKTSLKRSTSKAKK